MPTLQKRKLRLWEAPKGAGPAPGEGLGWTLRLTSHCLEGGVCRPGPLLGGACRVVSHPPASGPRQALAWRPSVSDPPTSHQPG